MPAVQDLPNLTGLKRGQTRFRIRSRFDILTAHASSRGVDMRRRDFLGVLGGTAISLVICALVAQALAQGGSTGGSIGKRNKSVSGVEDAPGPREPAAPPHRRVRPEHEARGSASVNGHWRWSCDCASGKSFRGTFSFAQTGSDFTGTMTQQTSASGTVSGGKASGGGVSFTVTLTNIVERTEHWTGRLTGGHMQGTLTTQFDGACQFTADR